MPAPAVGTDSTETATTDTGDTADPGTSTLADPETASGLVEMTITVTATGLGADNLAFLQAIALTGPRSALLSETQLAPVESGDGGISGPSTLTVTLTIFSAPLPAADQVALEKLLSGG